MGNPAEEHAGSTPKQESLPERFWSLARGMEVEAGEDPDPAEVVKHVLAVLDAFERGETAEKDVSLRTLSFLKLLREAELRGEVSYAAPEQIRGETVDERSLVFSVGVLLFERLTGRHPYGAEGNRPRRLARMQKGEFGSGVNYFPHVPPGLRRILMRAMGPFPEERWSTLKDMREHLEDFIAHEDDGVRLPGTPSSSRKKTAGAKSRKPLKPAYESQPTRVVDMSERVKMEREAIARRRARKDGAAADATREKERAEDATGPAGESAERLAASPATDASDAYRAFASNEVRPRLFGSAAPLVWALIGAAAASLAFLLFLRPESPEAATPAQATGEETSQATEPTIAEGAPTPEAKASPATAPKASPATAPKASPATAPKASPATAPKASQPAAPAVASFDPQLVGELALDAAWSCFDEASRRHGLMFGAGLLVDASDGHVRKVYFAGNEELTAAQRSCFRNKMAEFKVRTPPERNQVVDYQYRIHGEQRTVKVRAP